MADVFISHLEWTGAALGSNARSNNLQSRSQRSGQCHHAPDVVGSGPAR
jgi:hypothetical protein